MAWIRERDLWISPWCPRVTGQREPWVPRAPDSAPLSEWSNRRRPFPPPLPPVLEPCLRCSWPGTRDPKRSDSATDLPAFLPRQVRAYVVFWGGGSRGLPLRLTESSLPEFTPAWRRRSLCLGTSVFRPRTLSNHSQFLLPFSGRWKRRLSQTAVSLWKTQEPFFK